MTVTDKANFYCQKCNRTMGADQFYGSNNLEKYPEGKVDICKKCMTMHVDNFNSDTYLWIMQECDVPYVPDEWNKLMLKYGKDKAKLTGLTILGRYLSKMRLKQYSTYRWKDTEFLLEMANNKIEETMKRQGYDAQDIATAISKATIEIPEGELEIPAQFAPPEEEPDDYFGRIDPGADNDFDETLTDEDRTYLRLKWGKSYRPEEWIRLEQLYEEMMSSYDIQGAGHVDNLKLLCKTSLKANQLIDIGDVEGFQKMSRVYDNLMKSGKFTAAQNKSESGEFVDSIGELVAICEKEGFIPRYHVDEPQDKADRVLADLQSYTKNLINEETNLTAMIEKALREIEKDKEKEAQVDADDNIGDDAAFEESLFSETSEQMIQDEDFSAFNELQEEMAAEDEEFFRLLEKEGE